MENPNFKPHGTTDPAAAAARHGGHGQYTSPPPPYPIDPPAYFSASSFAPPTYNQPATVTTIYGNSGSTTRFEYPQTIQLQPTGRPQTTIIVTQPIVGIGPSPIRLQCPHCQADVTTRISYTTGMMTHVCCMVTFCFLCWPCAIIPYVTDCTKDVAHECPSCNRQVGIYKR